MINIRTDALKTDINLTTNCRIAHSRLLMHLMNFEIHVSVHILTIKISQCAHIHSCSYRKIVFYDNCRNSCMLNIVSGAFNDFSASGKFVKSRQTSHTCSALVMTENLSK